MAMFVDGRRWSSDTEYREARNAEMLAVLDSAATRAEGIFGDLKSALDARGLRVEIWHTGGGLYNLAIPLGPIAEGREWEGWRILVGEPDVGEMALST